MHWEENLKESYAEKYKKLSEELTDAVPRQVQLKPGSLIVVVFLFLFLGSVIYGFPFVVIPSLKENLVMTIGFISIPFSVVAIIFVYYFYSQKKIVQKWKKIIGKVERIWEEKMKNTTVLWWEVKYQNEGKSFSKKVGGYPDGQVGDPVVLLMNPQKPGACVSYAHDLLWRAIKKSGI